MCVGVHVQEAREVTEEKVESRTIVDNSGLQPVKAQIEMAWCQNINKN